MELQFEELKSLVENLVHAGETPDAKALPKLAQTLAKIFSVDPDEIAILTLSQKTKSLAFIILEKLAAVGSIPLSSTNALASRTARECRSEILNNFSSSRHATVFEGVPLGRKRGDMIQKIMSAPVQDGTTVVGVIQISRKGQSISEAGADFAQKDLRTLTSLSPILNSLLKLYREK